MIGRILDKIKRVYKRINTYSNRKEILLNELGLIGNPKPYEINNKRFYVREGRGDLAVLNEIYVRRDYDNYEFEKFDTIVDVGAHIGGFCIKYADRTKEILSFEPNSSNYQLLKKNLSVNKAENVKTFSQAVSDQEGDSELYSNSNSLRTSIEIKEDSEPSEKVETISLDRICTKWNLEGETLLKLDCEGSEFKIIENTDSSILRKFDCIFLEWHGDAGDPQEILANLKDKGFKIIENKKERDIENNVGFIFAERKQS